MPAIAATVIIKYKSNEVITETAISIIEAIILTNVIPL